MAEQSGLRRAHPSKRAEPTDGRPNFECVALLLQGGGALGAYQGGVYEALAEAGLHLDWVAGISIGAINSAVIAGNPPEERVAKLRSFWETITASPNWAWAVDMVSCLAMGDTGRQILNQSSAVSALWNGVETFFVPRYPPPWLYPDGSIEATSWYDTKALRQTLERFVDFDRVNRGDMRASFGAVNVRTGNVVYFDTERDTIRPEHILASGALPPGFSAVEIEGEQFWDGGLVSNTPLQSVLLNGPRQDTLAFQVDLWSARGDFPRNLADVETRRKEITYSSRTRNQTDQFRSTQTLRHAAAALMEALPEPLQGSPEAKLLREFGDRKVYNIVHLIYRARRYEGYSKDYEFSRRSMEEHWRAGYHDAIHTLRHPEALARPTNLEGVSVFDFAAK